MKRQIFAILAVMLAIPLIIPLVIPLVNAQIGIELKTVNPTVLREFSLPATYHIVVTPAEDILYSDNYYIDTLLDMVFIPSSLGTIAPGGFKGFDLNVYPSDNFKKNYYGSTGIEYYVRGDRTTTTKSTLTLLILPIADFMNIDMPPSITIDESRMTINLSAKSNYVENAHLQITSDLFSKELPIKLTKEVQPIDLDMNTQGKDAKVYVISFKFTIGNESAVVQKELILGPSITVSTSAATSGNMLSREFSITKTNTGNSPTKVTIEMSKSMWASLFTSSEGNPVVSKNGATYVYTWEKVLNPNESLNAVLKVNYYLPFLILILIIIAFAVYRAVTKSQIEVKKTAVRVKTKSGLFASKIILAVKNNGGPVSNVKVIDRLPAFTELLPERFGILEPTEIKKRSLVWEFPKLDKQEEIMFSYIVYSKITIFGKLEVPAALVTFVDRVANARETFSNKVYILAEEAKMEKF